MTSKQIITAIVNHDNPLRIGFDFLDNSDLRFFNAFEFIRPKAYPAEYYSFSNHEELKKQVSWFNGDVKLDFYGNIYGRLNSITKGECIKGFLEDWALLDNFELPKLNYEYFERLRELAKTENKYTVACSSVSIFSALRDTRLMENALVDTVVEQENVAKFLNKISEFFDEVLKNLDGKFIDAIMICDDWGTQESTFIGESSFVELFKPAYKRLCNSAHQHKIKVIMHSCGKNNLFLPHLIEAGVDVFQFDQPDVYPAEWLSNFSDKVTFYCPVDIQRIMPTGNRELIEKSAMHLLEVFKSKGGYFIAKDYPSWEDINVKKEWAAWAEKIFVDNANI